MGMGGGLMGADHGTNRGGFGGFFDDEDENSSSEEDGESEECSVSVGRLTMVDM